MLVDYVIKERTGQSANLGGYHSHWKEVAMFLAREIDEKYLLWIFIKRIRLSAAKSRLESLPKSLEHAVHVSLFRVQRISCAKA